MGICASCLGYKRRPSRDITENDPLLDDQQAQYGGTGGRDVPQPDEEDLRQEREELEHITNEATDNMIDVLHSGNNDLIRRFAHSGSHRSVTTTAQTAIRDSVAEEPEDAEDEERAWIRSIQASTGEDIVGVGAGALTLDVGQLRADAPAPGPAPKRSLRGNLAT